MKGLVAYHLLNAAAFENSSCSVDGHFQFIGTNGNGKTTNLRIPLYFYNPSGIRSDHAIDKSKNAFNDFYFRGSHSFIIFEICRGKKPDGSDDRYHVAVNRKGGRAPCFHFIDAPYRLDFYRSPEGKVCNEQQLMTNLLSHGIQSDQVNGYEDFKGIIYGTNVNARFKHYAFAIPKPSAMKSIYTIPRILSSIFKSETMKTGTLKDALIASLGIEEDQASIDLHNTGKELKQFNAKRRDVQEIEALLKRVKTVLDDYRNFLNSRTAMLSLARQIQSGVPKVDLSIQTNQAAKEATESELNKISAEFDSVSKQMDAKQSTLNQELGGLNTTRESIKETLAKYPEEKIAKWERSEQDLPQIESTLTQYKEELEALNEEFADIEAKYKKLEESSVNTFTLRRQKYEKSAGARELEQLKLRYEMDARRRQQIHKIESNSKQRKDELEQTRDHASRRSIELELGLRGIQLADYRRSEIHEIQQALQSLKKRITSNENALKGMPLENRSIQQTYQIQQQDVETKYAPIIRKENEEIERLGQQMEKIRPLVEQYEDSLLDYADQQNLSAQALRSLLREEVLLMPKGDILLPGDSPKTSLLGLNVNLEALPQAPELNYEQAKSQLEVINNKYKAKTANLEEIKSEHLKQLEIVESEHRNRREAHRVRLNELRSEDVTLSSETETQTRAHEGELTLQASEYQQASDKAKQEYKEAVEKFESAKNDLLKFNDELKSVISEIETTAKNETQQVELKITDIKTELSDSLDSLDRQKQGDLDRLRDQKIAELQDGSTNPEQIESTRQKYTAAENQLTSLRSDVDSLEFYRLHDQPKIQKLPEILNDLERVTGAITTINEEKQALETRKKQTLISLYEKKDELKSLLDDAKKDESAYEQWTQTFPREAKEQPTTSMITYRPGDLQELVNRFRNESTNSSNLWTGTSDPPTREHQLRGIAWNARQFLKPFQLNNLYGFPEQLDSNEEIEEFIVQKLEPLITTNVIERERRQILNAFQLTMGNLARDYQEMETYKTQLQRTLTGVEKSITGKKIFVSAIEKIEFRIEPSKSKLGTLRDNLKSCTDRLENLALDDSNNQDELFRRQPNSREIQTLMDQVQNLCNDIADNQIDRITLGDLFEMQIRITENGNRHEWKANIHGIGSEGTDTLAKVMIYVGILSHFKNAAFKNADELHLHCLVDEIGRIHSDYVSELLHFCNDRGIFLATASPESHRRPGDFQNTYLIERSKDQRQAKIRKVLQVGVSVA